MLRYALMAAVLPVAACLACGVPYPDPAEPTPGAGAATPARRVPVAAPAQTVDGRLPTAAPVATPARPSLASAVVDARLEKALRDLLGRDLPDYAVYVKDLRSGRVAAVEEDKVFYAASLFKVWVMYEVYRQHMLGVLELDQKLHVSDYYAGFSLIPGGLRAGDTVTVSEALRSMMSISDNAAAVLLLDRVGASNVNASLAALGLKHTSVTIEQTLPVTAADMGLLLETIARGAGLGPEARDRMLELLASERLDNGLAGALPLGTVVAHKTGNWDNATHDAGIVAGPSGNYILVVLSTRDHETAVIRAVSRLVYSYFNPPSQ